MSIKAQTAGAVSGRTTGDRPDRVPQVGAA
jgi:hypothetical protein